MVRAQRAQIRKPDPRRPRRPQPAPETRTRAGEAEHLWDPERRQHQGAVYALPPRPSLIGRGSIAEQRPISARTVVCPRYRRLPPSPYPRGSLSGPVFPDRLEGLCLCQLSRKVAAFEGMFAHFGVIVRSSFVACSRLDAILHVCYPIDSKREGKFPDLRTGYFSVLMCANEMVVCFTASGHRRGLRPVLSGLCCC